MGRLFLLSGSPSTPVLGRWEISPDVPIKVHKAKYWSRQLSVYCTLKDIGSCPSRIIGFQRSIHDPLIPGLHPHYKRCGIDHFIHPFWAIIECAVSTKLNSTRKGLWILAMLLTWTLASFLYGLFATYSPTLRRVSRICTIIIFLTLSAFGYLLLTRPELQDALLNGTGAEEFKSARNQARETQAPEYATN